MEHRHVAPEVDHVILYTGMDLPQWAGFFARLGFTVTPLGRHSAGSLNHLMVLRDSYIELIGFAPGTGPDVRPDVQRLPRGPSGIAFKGAPAPQWPATRAGRFNAVASLERPVDLDGVAGVARFRLTTLREPPPDLRVFFCSHLTPELVWHPPWQRHANGATGLQWLEFSCADDAAARDALRAAMGFAATDTAASWQAGATDVRVIAPGERSAVGVTTPDLAGVASHLADEGIAWTRRPDGGLQVALPEPSRADLVFVEQS